MSYVILRVKSRIQGALCLPHNIITDSNSCKLTSFDEDISHWLLTCCVWSVFTVLFCFSLFLLEKNHTWTTFNYIITKVRNRMLGNICGPYRTGQCVFSWTWKNKMWPFTLTHTPSMLLQPVNLTFCWISNWFKPKRED